MRRSDIPACVGIVLTLAAIAMAWMI